MQQHNNDDPDHHHREVLNQNMNSLEQDLKKQILGRSKAEKVFRPWWDTVEDYLLNCLVLLGKNLKSWVGVKPQNPNFHGNLIEFDNFINLCISFCCR